MKTCKWCKTTESHVWHKGPSCSKCYRSKNATKKCSVCNKEKTSPRWYKTKENLPKCEYCYNTEYIKTHQKVCIKCSKTESKCWYDGPKCRECWKKEYYKAKKEGTWIKKPDKFHQKSIRGKYMRFQSRNKKQRNLEFNIGYDFYVNIMDKPCYYCGADLLNEAGVGLDRIDNSKGYLEDNVLPCCGTCNRIRGDAMTVDEMLHVRNALDDYRKNKNENNKK